MGRAGITLNDVIRAAVTLLQRGENPSVRNVRRELGDTGSPNTIQEHLAAWRQQINAESLSVLPSSLPSSLIEPLETLFAMAIHEAEKNYQRERQAALEYADAAQAESNSWQQKALIAEQARLDLERTASEQLRQIESLTRDNIELKERLITLESKFDQRHAEAVTTQERLIIQLHHEREERRRDQETFETKLANAEGRIAVEAQRADGQQMHWIRQVDLARTETHEARAQTQSLQRRIDSELILVRKREEVLTQKLSHAEQHLIKQSQEFSALTTNFHTLEKALLEKTYLWQQTISRVQNIIKQSNIDDAEKCILLDSLLQQSA
jgi:colicin import membrane protein